jgi:protein SCO1
VKLISSALLAASLLSLAACSNRASKLPKYDLVPHFVMTDSEGLPFDSRQLGDKVWIADFIYTQCPGPCPMMSSQMHQLSERLKDDPDVRLISFSVDPAHDTPPVLSDFAHHFGGPTNQWVFVTGTPESVHQIAFTAFHLGDVITKMDHSTKFALVDKSGYVRGYYDSTNQNDLDTLLRDVNVLR